MSARFLLTLLVAGCLLSGKSLVNGKSLRKMTRDELRTMPLDLTDLESMNRYVRRVGLGDVLDEIDGDEDDDDADIATTYVKQQEDPMTQSHNIAKRATEEEEDDAAGMDIEVTTGQGEIAGHNLELPEYRFKHAVGGVDSGGSAAPGGGMATSPFASGYGVGGAIMNGCFGSGYVKGDPCYDASAFVSRCTELMEACTYIGTGYDARGMFGPESRKGNVLDNTCLDKKFYLEADGTKRQVPDAMQIEGIYDTFANTYTFKSREEYRRSLEMEAGISGSYGGFQVGMEAAYGQEEEGSSEAYLSVMSINIIRYEAYMAKYEVSMMDPLFVSEFVNLPINYFATGAARQYQEFIMRWGTHTVRSADFGGKLEIRQAMMKSAVSSVQDFDVKVQASYQSFFSIAGHFGIKGSFAGSKESTEMSTSIQVEGGSPMIAMAIADGHSTDIRTDLHDWLESIKDHPKPFNFRLARLTELLRFSSADFFPKPINEDEAWGCASVDLHTDDDGNQYFWAKLQVQDPETNKTVINKERRYCNITTKEQLTEAIRERRESLDRAITVYLLQGPIAYGEFTFTGHQDCYLDFVNADALEVPDWDTLRGYPFRIRLGLPYEIKSRSVDLKPTEEFSVGFSHKLQQWYYGDVATLKVNHSMDSYSTQKMLEKMIINIGGLYMTFNETEGHFYMDEEDYKRSLGLFPDIGEEFMDRPIAFAEAITPFHSFPCASTWNSVQRVNYYTGKSTCLEFLAASTGSIYVIFASNPERKTSWYTTLITPGGVGFYKGDEMLKHQVDSYLSALGSQTLLQSYIVCGSLMEINGKQSYVIEYGKAPTAEEDATIYMVMVDLESDGIPTFYGFGAGDEELVVSRARAIFLDNGQLECGPHLERDPTIKMCIDVECHEECVPLSGCTRARDGVPKPTECAACVNLIDYVYGEKTCVSECRNDDWFVQDGICILKCGDGFLEVDEVCYCVLTNNGVCVDECPARKERKFTDVGGIYTCECIIETDTGICQDYCPTGKVKIPSYPGFYKCEAVRGTEILIGKYAIGGILQDGVRTVSDCMERCSNETRLGDKNSCGGIEFEAREGGKCYLHTVDSSCGTLMIDVDKTLIRRSVCGAPGGYQNDIRHNFYYPKYHKLAWIGTFTECVQRCDGTSGCRALNFNVNRGACYLIVSGSNCDMDERPGLFWIHIRKTCSIPTTSDCLYTIAGKEYRGDMDRGSHTKCNDNGKCRNSGEHPRPWCFWDPINTKPEVCNIPMCAPYGFDVRRYVCKGASAYGGSYDKQASLRDCAIACYVVDSCKSFMWDTRDNVLNTCNLYTSAVCDSTALDTGAHFRHTYGKLPGA